MRSIEGAWGDVVEAVVVDARQAVGAIGVGPDPALEFVLDLLQLRLRRLGVDDIEDAALAVAILHGVEDLRHAAVQRVGEELARMPPIGAPFGRAGRHPAELACLHRPRSELGHVVDFDVGAHRLLDESDDIGGRDPWRAEPRRDVGRAEIGGLDALQRSDIALVLCVECGRRFCRFELVAHGA